MLFDLPPRLVHSRQNRHRFFNERIVRPCPLCGKDVAFEPRAIGVICGHCRSPLHRQPDDDTPLGPTAVLPFRLSEEEALAKFAEADAQRKPGTGNPGRVRAVRRLYAPFWRFTAHVVASWTVSEYDRVDERHESKHGGFTADYDEAAPAALFAGETGALADFRPTYLAQATPYDVSELGETLALPPDLAVANAWSDMRERWEAEVQKTIGRDRGESMFTPSEITGASSDYSQERAALVYVPVFVAERDGEVGERPVVIDGYSGEARRARRRKSVAETEAESLQVPDAAVGVGVLIVIALVLLALTLWVLRHLYWY